MERLAKLFVLKMEMRVVSVFLCLISVQYVSSQSSSEFLAYVLRALTRGSSQASASASSYFLPEPRTTSLPYATQPDYSVITLSETYSKTREQPNSFVTPTHNVKSEWGVASNEPYIQVIIKIILLNSMFII